MAKKRWSDLSTPQKRGIALSGAVQIGLLIAALLDIHRRPAGNIRGSKRAWTAVSFINFAGPSTWSSTLFRTLSITDPRHLSITHLLVFRISITALSRYVVAISPDNLRLFSLERCRGPSAMRGLYAAR